MQIKSKKSHHYLSNKGKSREKGNMQALKPTSFYTFWNRNGRKSCTFSSKCKNKRRSLIRVNNAYVYLANKEKKRRKLRIHALKPTKFPHILE